jgi:hypothetical protein
MGFLSNFFKPWLKRNYNNKIFFIKVKYVIHNLYPLDRIKIEGKDKWQEKKTAAILGQLQSGKNPFEFEPIRLILNNSKEEFRVDDGISRLRAFRDKRIGIIKAEIRVGE